MTIDLLVRIVETWHSVGILRVGPSPRVHQFKFAVVRRISENLRLYLVLQSVFHHTTLEFSQPSASERTLRYNFVEYQYLYIFFYRPPTRLYLFTLLQMRFSGTSQDGEDYLKPDSLRFAIFYYKGYILRHVIAAFSVLYMLCITFIWFVLVLCLRGTSLKLHVSYLIFQNSSFNIRSIRRSLFHFIYFNVLLRPLTKNNTTLE